MARISSPAIGLDNENLIPYIEHRLGTQSKLMLKFPSVNILAGYTFRASIEEIDTPPGTPPAAGYLVVTNGEKWQLDDRAFVKSRIQGTGDEGVPPIGSKVIFLIPAGLGMATSRTVSASHTRSGTPATQPKPGQIKYYQMGIFFENRADLTSEEIVLQFRLLYSVVSQNAAGE